MRDYYQLTDEGRRRRLKPLAQQALAEYDLDVVRMRGLTDATNGIFRLDTADGSRYAMRVGLGPPAGHTREEMESEVALLEAFEDEPDLIIPQPVRSRNGHGVVMASGDGVPHSRPCVVFSWLDGPLLAERLDTVTLEQLGATMAHLHRAGSRFDPPAGFVAPTFDSVYPYDLPFTVFTDAGPDLLPPSRRSLFAQAYDLIEQRLDDVQRRGPVRVMHGDLHPWNAKILRGRVAVFDFEDMVWGWPVQDIATTLYYFWPADDFDERWAQLRAGYEQVLPWPDHGGDVAVFIMARTLLIANDVISQPEWFDAAPEIYERGEQRIRDMLARLET